MQRESCGSAQSSLASHITISLSLAVSRTRLRNFRGGNSGRASRPKQMKKLRLWPPSERNPDDDNPRLTLFCLPLRGRGRSPRIRRGKEAETEANPDHVA